VPQRWFTEGTTLRRLTTRLLAWPRSPLYFCLACEPILRAKHAKLAGDLRRVSLERRALQRLLAEVRPGKIDSANAQRREKSSAMEPPSRKGATLLYGLA
jgi:hypothetical protein